MSLVVRWSRALVAALSIFVAGCGGGGAGDPPSQPQLNPSGGQMGAGDPQTTVSAAHPKVLLNHASTFSGLQQQLASQSEAAVRFQNFVDSELASPGRNYGFEAWFAALMYQLTGQNRYADFAVSRVDAFVASEEALIRSGQKATVSGDSYLYVGPIVGDVALVYDWCHARLTASQRERWVAYMNQAVRNVWDPAHASWGGKLFPWSGWSVNNPSNNYYYSFLKATMLLGLATQGENDMALGWRQHFRETKLAAELFPVFNRDLVGGGSREGTGYGVAMKELFLLFDWWERSTGERLASLTPHTQGSQAWLLHTMVPTLDRLVAIGDQARESSAALFDYHREYLLALTALFPDERLSGAAKAVLDASSVPRMAYGFELWADFLYAPANLPVVVPSALSTAYWAAGTGQLFMRSAWSDRNAAYAAFTCGPYTESHAHRDQGAFQVFRGEWLAPTSNIYTHSGIQQGEEHNNLVRIVQNGVTVQQGGNTSCQMSALADNVHFTYGLAKVTPVYAGKAAVSKVEREFLFIKPSTFVVFDRVASASGTQRVWTLNMPPAVTMNANADRLTVTTPKANVLDVYRVSPSGLTYQLSSPGLADGDTWLSQAGRAEVKDMAGTQSLFLHVMGTNGAVSAVARSDSSGSTGAQITLGDGRRVLVRFANGSNDGGTGGSLEIQQANGAIAYSGKLPTGVVAPPLFAN